MLFGTTIRDIFFSVLEIATINFRVLDLDLDFSLGFRAGICMCSFFPVDNT